MFKNIVSIFFIKKIISILGLAYILITYYTSKVTFSDKLNIDSLCKENENYLHDRDLNDWSHLSDKSLISKFGEGATKSGATLKGIFEKAIGKKSKKEK